MLLLGLSAAGSLMAGQAMAGCGGYRLLGAVPVKWEVSVPPVGRLMPAVWRPDAGGFMRVADRAPLGANIVGTWRFTWTSDGTAYPAPIPLGAVVDFGTQQWHDDGTELIISGGRPPGSGDTCMGSWQQTGPSTYRFRHIGLAWANSDSVPPSTPAMYIGPAIIQATVTLNRAGNAYEGNFTLDQYAKDEVTLLEHIAGSVTATRFGVN
jgi:hypothetical protein